MPFKLSKPPGLPKDKNLPHNIMTRKGAEDTSLSREGKIIKDGTLREQEDAQKKAEMEKRMVAVAERKDAMEKRFREAAEHRIKAARLRQEKKEMKAAQDLKNKLEKERIRNQEAEAKRLRHAADDERWARSRQEKKDRDKARDLEAKKARDLAKALKEEECERTKTRMRRQTRVDISTERATSAAARILEIELSGEVAEFESPGRRDSPRVSMLESEWNMAQAASILFPPVLTAEHLRNCSNDYHELIERNSNRFPCGDCGRLTSDIQLLSESDPVAIKCWDFLDSCARPNSINSSTPSAAQSTETFLPVSHPHNPANIQG